MPWIELDWLQASHLASTFLNVRFRFRSGGSRGQSQRRLHANRVEVAFSRAASAMAHTASSIAAPWRTHASKVGDIFPKVGHKMGATLGPFSSFFSNVGAERRGPHLHVRGFASVTVKKRHQTLKGKGKEKKKEGTKRAMRFMERCHQ